LEPVRALKRAGWQTALVKPTRQGVIKPDALAAAMTGQAQRPGSPCTLVSIMAANNEVGTLQPITDLAAVAHGHSALFCTDAVQALGKIPFDVGRLGVDAASFSAHKLGGPKGVGAFYLRSLTPFSPHLLGGGQERGLRSGTANVAGAVGFARALEMAVAELDAESTRLCGLRDRLAAGLCATSSRVSLTVDPQEVDCLPNLLSVLVAGRDSEGMIISLDSAGFSVSGGSACSTGSLEPSHVLIAMGVSRRQAEGVLRISMGHGTTGDDVDAFIEAFAKLV
jgi:cysteine desulfurase